MCYSIREVIRMSTTIYLIRHGESEANEKANNSGINIEFSGNTSSAGIKSVRQSIKAGETVGAGTIVTVYFVDENAVDFAE